MKLYEMQNRQEAVQNKLCAIHETVNAIGASLEQGLLKGEQVGYALMDIADSIGNVTREMQGLVEGIIEAQKILESL